MAYMLNPRQMKVNHANHTHKASEIHLLKYTNLNLYEYFQLLLHQSILDEGSLIPRTAAGKS